MFVDMMNALGGNGVAMGYDQVFSALQTGVVDGAENNPPSYVFDNHYTVAKYYTLTEHLIVPEILVFSRKTWDTLSKDDQALVKKFGREAQLEERVLWNKYEAAALDKAKAAGNEIIDVADKKPFQDAVKPVWDKYGPKYAGHDQAHPGRFVDREPSAIRVTSLPFASIHRRQHMALFYRKLMDALYLVCVVVAGTALVLISAVIPWAVFTRYVLNSAASWPEPTAVLLTIVLTFIGAAACYRRQLHMNVSFFVQMFPPRAAHAHRALRRAPGRRPWRCS